MAAGTLNVTNNSKAVTGSGTTFTSLKAGDFLSLVVGQVPYTVAIESIQSNTALTLALPFDGPTSTGLAWDSVSRDTMSLATMGVTVQAQKALRMLIADENNWRAIFGDAEQISVTLLNGTVMQGMSWGYLSSLLKDVDPVELQNIANQAVNAKNQAVTAKNDAVSAKNDAQTAKTAAETARTQAQSAKTAAETARTQAQTAKTAAETARTHAQTAKTAAETAQGAAEDARDEAKQYAEQAGAPYKQVLQPLPDVWVPFNDSLDMLAGFAPGYKTVTVADDEVTMPSDKVVSFKRASTATYINKSGEFKIAEIDEPRFEKYGLLIEGQRTNYFSNSNTPESWNTNPSLTRSETKTDSRGFTYATFTPGSYVGQVGTYSIIAGASASPIDAVQDDHVTISFRAKGAKLRIGARFDKGSPLTTVAIMYVDMDDLSVYTSGADADNLVVKNVSRDGEWVLVEAIYKVTDDSAQVRGVVSMANQSGALFDATSTVDVTTPQVELGISASSFIPTASTPTTRASDMVNIPVTNNLPNIPISVMTEVRRGWDKAPSPAPRIANTIGVANNSEQIILAFRNPADPSVQPLPYAQMGAAQAYVPAGLQPGRLMVAGFVGGSNGKFKAVVNGTMSPESTSNWAGPGAATQIRIGGSSAGGERHLFGHVRNFRIWHKALTDLQMGELV